MTALDLTAEDCRRLAASMPEGSEFRLKFNREAARLETIEKYRDTLKEAINIVSGFQDILRKEQAARGVTQERMAQEMGLAQAAVSRILNTESSRINVATLLKMLRWVLGEDFSQEITEDAGS